MNIQGILTLMGFAQKAGKLAAGESAVENFLKKGRVRLLVLSEELSEQRRDFWQKQAQLYEITAITIPVTKVEIGLAVGQSQRGIIGMMDSKMAEAVMKKLED